jgi:hypothetical protein
MSIMKWNKGVPPSMGWWPARIPGREDAPSLRWWNGKVWSWPVMVGSTQIKHIVACAGIKSLWSDQVVWADRPADWPARSRT